MFKAGQVSFQEAKGEATEAWREMHSQQAVWWRGSFREGVKGTQNIGVEDKELKYA